MPDKEPKKYDVSTFLTVVDRMSGELKKIADIIVPNTPMARDIGKPIAGGPKQWNHPYAQYARGTEYEPLFQKIHLLNKDLRALAAAVDNISPEATQWYRTGDKGGMEDMVEAHLQAAKATCENYLTRGTPDLYGCVGKLLAGQDGLSLLVGKLAGVVHRMTDNKHSKTLGRALRGGFWPAEESPNTASESNDPRVIANLLSEDINVNNGFLIEAARPYPDDDLWDYGSDDDEPVNTVALPKGKYKGIDCVVLKDETWFDAEEIIRQAWVEGYRYFVIDQGVMLFKTHNPYTSLYGYSPKAGVEALLARCEDWWVEHGPENTPEDDALFSDTGGDSSSGGDDDFFADEDDNDR